MRDSVSNAQELERQLATGEITREDFSRSLDREISRGRIRSSEIIDETPRVTRQLSLREDVTKRLASAEAELARSQEATARSSRLRGAVGSTAYSEYQERLRGRISGLRGQQAALGAPIPVGGGGTQRAAPTEQPPVVDEKQVRTTERLGTARAGLSRETSYLIQQQSAATSSVRRYGTLNAEFINDAARGRVTIRELGRQTVETTGKFGAWIGAGAAVYGAIGALYQVGEGAIEADRGISEVKRSIDDLDTDAAKRSFRELAEEFNLPVSEVTSAAGQMAKVFHDQDEAMLATRAALYSVRVGELETATATRYLTSIIQGFELPASQMETVFNQINQAQNRFGVQIESTEAGVARAAGTFRAAGGDFDSLLALIATGSRATGQSGNIIGTALGRAPNFLRQQENIEYLKQFGINAADPIDQVIEEAFKVAQDLSGQELQKLAAAIGGPQYGARVFTPLLQQFDLYQRVLADTSPEASRGSAEKELQDILDATAERAKEIITQLEILGSNLEQAGFFDGLGVGLGLLREMFNLANGLLEVFNQLPEPVRDMVSYAIQLRAALALLRGLNLGETIGAGAPQGSARAAAGTFFLPQGGRAQAGYVKAGLEEEARVVEQEQLRSRASATRASIAGDLAEERAVVLEREAVARQRAGATQVEVDRINADARNAREAVSASRQRAQLADIDAEAARKQLAANADVQRSLRGRFGRFDPKKTQTYLQTSGQPFVPGYETTPRTQPVQAVSEGGVILPPGVEQQAQQAEVETRRFGRRFSNVTGKLRSAGARLGGAATSVIGKLGTIAFGAFAFFTALDYLKGIAEDIGDQADQTLAGVDSAKAAAQKLKQLRDAATSGDSFGETVADFFTGSGRFHGPLEDLFGIGGEEGAGETRRSAAEFQRANLRLQARERERAREEGEVVPFRYTADIDAGVKRAQDESETRGELQTRLRKLDEELSQSVESLGQGKGSVAAQRRAIAKVRDQIKDAELASSANRDLFQSLLRVRDPTQLTETLETELAVLSGGINTQSLERAATIYSAIRVQLGDSKAPDDIEALQNARESFFDGVDRLVQEELDEALTLAKSPGARRQAYSAARTQYRQAYVTEVSQEIDDQRGRVQRLRETITRSSRGINQLENRAQKAIEEITGKNVDVLGFKLPVGEVLGGLLGQGITEGARGGLKELRDRLNKAREQLGQLTKEKAENLRELKLALQALDEAEYEELAGEVNALAALRSARTADPLVQARNSIEAVNRLLSRAIEVYGRNSEEVYQLLTERQTAIGDLFQSRYERIEASANLDIAQRFGPGQEIGQARAEIERDKRLLAIMEANRDRFDPAQIINLEAEIIDAEQQLAEDVRDRAFEIRSAAQEVVAAQAEVRGNDVGVAKAELRQAQLELRQADTAEERRSARADVIRRRGNLRDERAQRRIQAIEFDADIDRITVEQEIAAYERVLRTQKLSLDTRRDLRRKIHQLKQEADDEDFDLTVGDIELPTIYEIKRAIGEGGGGSPIAANYSQQNNITINTGASAERVGVVVNDVINGPIRSARRSSGLVP